MDYGHPIEFGLFLTPTAERTIQVLELAELAEALGLDLVAIQDHPYQRRFLDTWTLLSAIGGAHPIDPAGPGRGLPAAAAAGHAGRSPRRAWI